MIPHLQYKSVDAILQLQAEHVPATALTSKNNHNHSNKHKPDQKQTKKTYSNEIYINITSKNTIYN